MNDFSKILKKPKSKVLILRSEGSLGDAVLTSGYYSSLKQFNKDIEINVFCFHSAYEYCKILKEIDHLYRIRIKKIRKHRCFIYFFLLGVFFRLKKIDLIIDDNPFEGLNWKMFRYLSGEGKIFNDPTKYPSVSDRVKGILAKLGVPYVSPSVEISPQIKNKINAFLSSNNIDKYIVFNCFGSKSHKSFTPDTFKKMFMQLRRQDKNITVIFPYQPFQKNILKNFYIEDKHLFFYETSSPQDVFALMGNKENILLISPDTSFVHIATLFKRPTIAVLKDIDCYKTLNELATEITASQTNVNDFDIKLFAEALKKYL